MERRKFLRGMAAGALGMSAAALAACGQASPDAPAADGGDDPAAQAPAQGSDLPQLQWDMPTSWTPAIDVLFGAATRLGERVAQLTDGRFQITAAESGKIVPGLQVLDAVQANTAPCGHTASFYYVGKNAAFGIGTALPFGLNAQQQNAWLYAGGGREALEPLYSEFGIVAIPAGNTTVQMGGWFNKEINSLSDMQGLKMRIPGLGGQVMERLGVVPQTIAGGEIFQALSTNTIDAAEWIGPHDEEKLGLNQAAEFYYYPGWWEPGATLDFYVNKDEWEALPDLYKNAIQVACAEANVVSIAEYDAKNLAALQRMVAEGTQLRPYSQEIMEGAQTAAFELYEESAADDPTFFGPIYEQWLGFRDQVYQWNFINEFSFSNFVYRDISV